MCRHLHLPIRSISIQFKAIYKLAILLLVYISCFTSAAYADQDEWQLSGIFLSDFQEQAMFIDSRGIERLVNVGESIQDCELISLHKESADLLCEEQLYTLSLRNSLGDLSFNNSNVSQEIKQQTVILSKKELKDFVKQRQRLVSEISFLPVVNEEKIIGFSVSKIKPNSTVAELGLFNGDVIIAINGVSASDINEFLYTVNKLNSATQVSVEIDRYGANYAYTYVLE